MLAMVKAMSHAMHRKPYCITNGGCPQCYIGLCQTAATVENIPQLVESAERAFNRLARTFTTQIDALKRYRSKGEQKVTGSSM